MQNKSYIVLVLIALIAFVLSKQDFIVSNEINKNGSKPVVESTENKLVIKERVLNKPKSGAKENVNVQLQEDIFVELNQQKFSSEPIVEFMTVTYIVSKCKKGGLVDFNSVSQSKKLEKLMFERSKKCQNLIKDYPTLASKKRSKDLKPIMVELALKSQYAETMKKAMAMSFMDQEGKDDFLQEFVGLILKSQNGPLISSLMELITSLEGRFLVNKLSGLLGTINNSYTEFVYQQAVILYSCNYTDAITCLPSSEYMITQCYNYEGACGLDVATWFALNHTSAHNRDIARVMDFLENVE